MKITNLKYCLILLFSFALITGCDDDPEVEVSPLVGSYVISHAEVTEPFSLSTVQGVGLPVVAGMDITEAIQAALLSAVTCPSADKSYIELKEDNTIFMSCEGENAFNAGTWEELSETSLKLNMNSTAIPSSPTGFVLTVNDIVIEGNTLTGSTSVPMPYDMFSAGAEAFGFTMSDTPPVYMVSFSLDLTKQ